MPLARHRGLLVALAVFIVLLAITDVIGAGGISYFQVSFLSSGGATLAIAAIGETLVVLVGGFDLSVGAVISLVNVVLATSMQGDPGSMVLWSLIGVGVGVAAGLFNALFIAVLRLQSIVVTLSTMFIVQGITLLVMDKPGGMIPPTLGALIVGDAVPGVLPMPIVILAGFIALWLYIRSTRFGTAIYAIGSDAEASRSAGIRVPWIQIGVYVLAGACYGLAGVFVSAQTGAGDPLIGNSLLLQVFTAIVVGGTVLGGGRGGPARLDHRRLCPDDGRQHSARPQCLRLLLDHRRRVHPVPRRAQRRARPKGALAGHIREHRHAAARAGGKPCCRASSAGPNRRLGFVAMPARRGRGRALLGPPCREPALRRARLCLLRVVILATQYMLGNAFFSWQYYDSLIVLSSFLAILALGQGAVILTGGLDLSLPWSIALCGILLAGMVKGSDAALVYALPTRAADRAASSASSTGSASSSSASRRS